MTKPQQERTGKNLGIANKEVLEALLLNPANQSLTIKQIAAKAGVSTRTVSYARRRLAERLAQNASQSIVRKNLKAGAIIQSLTRPTGEEAIQGVAGAQDILAAFPDASILTTDQLLTLLSILAKDSPPAVQVAAIKLLDDLRARHQPPASLGPPPPMTDDEKVERLARLIECVGPDITLKATQKVFGVPDVEPPA